ncbi:MAG: hypothetical protein EHM77_02810, partial [Planctomycetaceae bacterium]
MRPLSEIKLAERTCWARVPPSSRYPVTLLMNHKHAFPLSGVDQPPPGRLNNLVDIAKWRAERMADEVAFTFLRPGENRVESITYQDLDYRIRGLAAALASQGKPGDRVLIAQPPGLDYI